MRRTKEQGILEEASLGKELGLCQVAWGRKFEKLIKNRYVIVLSLSSVLAPRASCQRLGGSAWGSFLDQPREKV